MPERGETTSQRPADVACSDNSNFHICLCIQVRIRSGLFRFRLDGISRHCACERFFAISKEIVFPSGLIAGEHFCSPLALDRPRFLTRAGFTVSPFLGHSGDWVGVLLEPIAAPRASLVWLARVPRS